MHQKLWYNKAMEEKNICAKNRIRETLKISRREGLLVALAVLILLVMTACLVLARDEAKEPLVPRETQWTNVYDPDAFFLDEKGRLCYEDTRWTSLIGVDVSSYQNEVNWKQVAADGVELAMIRLGYRGYSSGQMNLDPCYEDNVKGAGDAGLYVGVYFFSQAVSEEEARDEARFVLRKIRGKKIDGPIAYDMEYIDGAYRINSLTVEEKTKIAEAFCQIIEENGYEAMIYGNPTWFMEDVNVTEMTHHGIWLAHYTEMTQWPYDYWMWQYTDQGSVAGIEGPCDLNIWLQGK